MKVMLLAPMRLSVREFALVPPSFCGTTAVPVIMQVMKKLRKEEKPLVIDADGLYIVTKNLDLVKGYPHAILTPNKNEYERLADRLGIDIEQVSLRAH